MSLVAPEMILQNQQCSARNVPKVWGQHLALSPLLPGLGFHNWTTWTKIFGRVLYFLPFPAKSYCASEGKCERNVTFDKKVCGLWSKMLAVSSVFSLGTLDLCKDLCSSAFHCSVSRWTSGKTWTPFGKQTCNFKVRNSGSCLCCLPNQRRSNRDRLQTTCMCVCDWKLFHWNCSHYRLNENFRSEHRWTYTGFRACFTQQMAINMICYPDPDPGFPGQVPRKFLFPFDQVNQTWAHNTVHKWHECLKNFPRQAFTFSLPKKKKKKKEEEPPGNIQHQLDQLSEFAGLEQFLRSIADMNFRFQMFAFLILFKVQHLFPWGIRYHLRCASNWQKLEAQHRKVVSWTAEKSPEDEGDK